MTRKLCWLVPAALALALEGPAVAQRPGGPGGPGGMPPQMQAAFAKMRAFNQSHPNYRKLQGTLMGLNELEKDKKLALNKKQSQHVLAVFKAYEGKPTLTNAQAGEVSKKLTEGLSAAQVKAIDASEQQMMQRRRGMGGPGGPGRPGGGPGAPGGGPRAFARPGGGGPGGPGRPGGRPGMGGPGGFRMPEPKEFNPLNANTLPFPPMRARTAESLHALKARLAATK